MSVLPVFVIWAAIRIHRGVNSEKLPGLKLDNTNPLNIKMDDCKHTSLWVKQSSERFENGEMQPTLINTDLYGYTGWKTGWAKLYFGCFLCFRSSFIQSVTRRSPTIDFGKPAGAEMQRKASSLRKSFLKRRTNGAANIVCKSLEFWQLLKSETEIWFLLTFCVRQYKL